jgi:tripartite-type tricarboxylate transporter receptor subunit TctC
VTIKAKRKSKAETKPIVSTARRTQRRSVGVAVLYGHPSRVRATKLPRRQFLHLAAGAAALPVASSIARAQTYPTRPVRLIVPYIAGDLPDAMARIVAQNVSERLGQPIIIENRPGAGANIGTEYVAKSPPDGYTLLFITTANAINGSLYPNLSFNFNRDIVAVAGLARVPIILEANPSVPARTVAEFVAYAKANPGKVNAASQGVGTSVHLALELFKAMAGVNIVHVPYRGSALPDLLAGQVQVAFDNPFNSREHIKTGGLRVLAVASAERLEMLPGVPTIAETVPGFEASSLFGVGAPAGTAVEIIERLNREINAALADPRINARLIEFGNVPIPSTPGVFHAELIATSEKWAKVIRAANIKL